jgi:hypothetical protein
MRQVMLKDGRLAWVNDEGVIVGISDGMGGAVPGFGSAARTRDIMSRLPDADVVGLRGPGVMPGGERAVGARRIQVEEVHKIQPPSAPTYRPLGGAQQNNRGQTRIVTLNPGSLNFGPSPVQNIGSVVETPKANGDDAEVLSVQLGMLLPPQLTDPADLYALVPVDVTALIEWGIGGTNFTAEADWNQGTSFAISASFLRISARVGAIPLLNPALPSIDISLNAALGYGNASSLNVSSPLRRTIVVSPDPLPPFVLSTRIPIPLWAVGVTLVDAGFGAPNYDINLYDGISIIARYQVTDRTNNAIQAEGQFPIPAQARFIDVNNNSLFPATPKLIFNLAF